MSIVSSSSSPTLTSSAESSKRGLLSIYAELTKVRLSALVVMSTAVGYIAATSGLPLDWTRLIITAVGTALAAASASILNQLIETRLDARMERTRHRPFPSGAISARHGLIASIIFAHVGVTMLGVFVNLLTATLAVITILTYVLLYTPLKTRSSLNTLVGAVCGAIPPMIGWAAARGSLDFGAWVLGAILFVWQLPHFLSLAWLYRADYERGGFAMLPKFDASGALTGRISLITSLMLVPLGLMVTLSGLAGWWFALGSVLLALWMIRLVIKLFHQCNDANARRVFLASLLYLSLLLSLLVLDRGPIGMDRTPLLVQEAAADVATASLVPHLPGH